MLLLPASTGENASDPMRGQLILSTFSGADLLGRAFEDMGACVVSAGDILLGRDVRRFKALKHRFNGVIGGPPCQQFSNAGARGTSAENLIPEFLRIVEEAEPEWAVMENVTEARAAAPAWENVTIEDFDCGGHTSRIRTFWFYGMPAAPVLPHRPGKREYSVLASNWHKRKTYDHFHGHYNITPDEAAYLQGYPELAYEIMRNLPTPNSDFGLTQTSRRILAIHMLGNGVPAAMGNYIAGHVAYYLRHRQTAAPVQVPMFDYAA